MVADGPLEGDAEGGVPEPVAGDGQRQQRYSERREVAQHARGHLVGRVGVGGEQEVARALGVALGVGKSIG